MRKVNNFYHDNENNLEGRGLLLKMDVLKRYFGVTARMVFQKAGIKHESFANDVLHGRKSANPTLKKIEKAILNFSHSKKIRQVNF